MKGEEIGREVRRGNGTPEIRIPGIVLPQSAPGVTESERMVYDDDGDV